MRGAIPEGVAPITVIHGNRPVIPLHGILAKGTNASNQCHAAEFYKVATGGFLFLADAASHARDAESVSMSIASRRWILFGARGYEIVVF